MGRTPTSCPNQIHISADGTKLPLRSNREPNFVAGIPLLGGSTPLLGFFPPGDPNHHSVVGLTPTRSSASNLPLVAPPSNFKPLYKFADKQFREPIIAQNIWYIHEFFFFELFPRYISFMWLKYGEIKHFGEAQLPKYYPNISFMYVCMYCSFRDNTECVCLAYNCTRHTIYTWMFSYLDYPLDVLVRVIRG